MNRYDPDIYEDDEVREPKMASCETGEYLSLTDVIEFIRSGEPSLLTDFYAAIDPKRVQR